MAEMPASTTGLILNQVGRGYDFQTDIAVLVQERTSVLAAAEELPAHHSSQDRQPFKLDLNHARRAWHILTPAFHSNQRTKWSYGALQQSVSPNNV
jgi:hypothetical protein